MSVRLYPCILCVALLIDLFVLCVACLTVFGVIIRNVFGCCCYFVVECYGSVLCVVLCWIDHVWSSKECACCACDPSVPLSVSSIGFVYVFVCRKLSSHLRV